MSDFTPGDYKTRGGRDAKVLGIVPEPTATDFPLLGAVWECGEWRSTCWTKDGHRNPNATVSSRDLVKPPREWWAAMWTGPTGIEHLSRLCDARDDAQKDLDGFQAPLRAIALVKVTEVSDE